MKNKVLILGKIPPPVGGVTIHVSRLVRSLVSKEYEKFDFFYLKNESLRKLVFQLSQYKVVHLHTSNTYFQLMMAIYCKVLNVKLMITYHGNWGRYGFFRNLLTKISAWLAFLPIVQNEGSLVKAKKWNKNSILVSAFIPPLDLIPLSGDVLEKVLDYRKKYKYLFCTNACRLSFDKHGNEIYGISALVGNISKCADSALIISDPSGSYCQYLTKSLEVIPENIFFLREAHDFWQILRLADAFVRNTTTDGDSISIHEAMACNVTVFASNCVSRPDGCILFKDVSKIDLEKELEARKMSSDGMLFLNEVADSTQELIKLYDLCLNEKVWDK